MTTANTPNIKELVELNNKPSDFISNELAQSTPYLSGQFNVEGAAPALDARQQNARDLLPTMAFPGNKDEPWRKTSIKDLPLEQLRISDSVRTHSGVSLQEQYLDRLVKPDTDKFTALAAGYARDGFVLVVPKNTILTEDLHAEIRVREDGTVQTSRVLIVVESGAEATLHLDFVGEDGAQPALHSGIVEIFVEDNARLHLVETQHLGARTWQFSHERASVGANASLDWVYFAFGGKLVKSFVDVELAGRGSEAQLNGLTITNSGQHIDLDTQQDHLAPNTTSNLNFKAALLGKSHSVWQGMIYVDPAATQTDGYQTSRNLLLDDRAHADAIPGLEIKTDDVRCSHGATISHVDEEQLFYLKTRGLDESEARELIVNGFFEEIVGKVRDEAARESLRAIISQKLTTES